MAERETTATEPPETALSRLEVMWGAEGLERIQRSTVMVLGVGGVGSNCIEALARGGVGTLIIVDGDAVAASNINRQAIAFTDTVGRRKVDVMREMIHRINPGTRVLARDAFVRAEDIEALIEGCRVEAGGRIDYLVDAIDTVSTKLAVADLAERTGIPLVSSMGGAMKLAPERLRIADIYETSGDALSRVMRKECRKRGIGRLDVLYSDEEPVARPDSPAPREGSRPPLGTASYFPPIMGQMLAGFVIRKLVRRGI